MQAHQELEDRDVESFCYSMPGVLPAGERGMDYEDGLDEHLHNSLVQKFSELSIDDPSLNPYIYRNPESLCVSLPTLACEHGSCSVYMLRHEGHHSCFQVGEATARPSQLARVSQNTAGQKDLLSEAEEALRRHIIDKTNRIYAGQGPDIAGAFLSAVCTLSSERFDQLWAGILRDLSFNNHATTSSSDTRSKTCDLSRHAKPRTAAERTQIWERKLDRFTMNVVGTLTRFVNRYWERLVAGLEVRRFQEDELAADKRLYRLCHYLELRRLEQEAELCWLQRALALIRNLRDFEDYLVKNGHPLSKGSNQRLRHAYLKEIYAAGSTHSDSVLKIAFKEDLRYAFRWMIFIRPFGLGAIFVCGEEISKLV
ncbi:hypothetical protein F5884DRAFT_864215 [Xylogone sp. PMI_703]|nr:hypothetical protein F5884DRAFT_864215 [Xylogone sp. PMI_703]